MFEPPVDPAGAADGASSPRRPDTDDAPQIIAHRGYSARAPENTIAALEAAIEAGARALEFDLHTAACGTPVLFHDPHLGRTTNGVGPLRRRTLQQLQALDAGSWFSEAFAGERIPSLGEALDAVAGRVDALYPEVKGYRELEDLDRMARIVEDAGLTAHTTFIAMDYAVLDRIRGRLPNGEIGYIVEKPERFDEALERAVAAGRAILDLDARIALARPETVRRARDAGLDVAVWTVDDPGDATRLWDLGVTRFTTNEVERLLAWAGELRPS